MISRMLDALSHLLPSRLRDQAPAASASAAMTPAQIWTYCATTLAVTVLALAWLTHAAAVAPGTMARSRTPQFAGQFAKIPMGGLYGTVTVRQLVNYYLQNPPRAPHGVVPARLPRIGGC